MNKFVSSSHMVGPRLASTAGIAIGPILFIIAVLGILAAAIAAGSGSFTTGTTSESNRAKATALIDIGQNLKIGFERIVGNGIAMGSVNIDPADTTATSDLFSPTGGGISSPSVTMSETPASDVWFYPNIIIPGIGTTAGGGPKVALIRVASGVCDEINLRANSVATPAAADLGDFTGATVDASASWPNALDGKLAGCVNNNNAASTGRYFYQVIGIQ